MSYFVLNSGRSRPEPFGKLQSKLSFFFFFPFFLSFQSSFFDPPHTKILTFFFFFFFSQKRLEPCCGDPCNPEDAIYCALCWYCCGWCSFAKHYASAIDQEECALVNHCLILCCNFCAVFNIITRHVIRVKLGAGPDDDDLMGWIGDLAVVWCCCCCTSSFFFFSLSFPFFPFLFLSLSLSFPFLFSFSHLSPPKIACQELRAVQKEDWDWWAQVQQNGTVPVIIDPFKLM